MIKKIYNKLYGTHWLFMHLIVIAIFNILIILLFSYLGTIDNVFKLINYDIINLSGIIAGFEFAGLSIFISLEGNKKIQILKDIDCDRVIYQIIIYSVLFLVVSIILMVIDINIFNLIDSTNILYTILKRFVDVVSIIALELGYMLFISSIKLLSWILK